MNRNAPNWRGYAWAVVALLWPVAMLNYLDRQMVSTIRSSIHADIPSIANDQDFGLLSAPGDGCTNLEKYLNSLVGEYSLPAKN